MTTEEIKRLAALRDVAERIGKSSYERLKIEDVNEVISYIIKHDRVLTKKIKEIIVESRQGMADKICMARQTTITFEENE